MNKEELTQKIMKYLRESLNESKVIDLKTNKDHKAAYNSFVKWYNHWKEKLGREEIRALVKKATNDALGDNLDMINEAYTAPKLIENPNIGKLPKVDIDDNEIYDEATNKKIATINIINHGALSKSCIIKFKSGLSLQDKLNYRDAILKDRTLKRRYNIQKSSFSANHPELFESLNESGIPGLEDDHLAFDLFLTFQSTHELYDLSQPMVDNLIRRLRKGEELSVDILAASSMVEKYTKATIEEYKRTVDGAPRINTATRKNLKHRIAQELINEAKDDYNFEMHDM